MNIRPLIICIFIYATVVASSKLTKANRQIQTIDADILDMDVETIKFKEDVLSLLKQIKEENSKGIRELSDGHDKLSKQIKDIKKIIPSPRNCFDIRMKGDATSGKEIRELSDGHDKLSKQIKDITKIIPSPRNCFDIRMKGDTTSGIRTVYPYLDSPERGVNVLCDQGTDNGGWTVFQARKNLTIRENFQRNWLDYSTGFGNLSGEFWMGLNLINVMSKLTTMDLRIDMMDDHEDKRYACYESFSVEDSDDEFRLNIGAYSGTAGDSLSIHNQMNFSTYDRNLIDCAKGFKGAWWYENCHHSNLNGFQYAGSHLPGTEGTGINWLEFGGHLNSLITSRMMFRPHCRNHFPKI